MAKRLTAFAIFLAALLASCSAFDLKYSREEMLSYYQTSIEPVVPKSAKTLLGDERINLYVGNRSFGIETKRGELYGFELRPISEPTIIVNVSEEAASAIAAKKYGVMNAIRNGGIKVCTSNFMSAIKVGMMQRIYAVSGADDVLTGKKMPPRGLDTYGALYIQRARIFE